MYTFLTRNGQTLAFGLGFVIVVLMLIFIFTGINGYEASVDGLPDLDPKRYETKIFDFGMYGAAFLVVACAIAGILFGIYQVATNPKGALKGLLGLAAVVVLLLILYATADADTAMLARQARDGFFVEPGQSKFITGAIATALIMAGGAVLALAVSEVISFFK